MRNLRVLLLQLLVQHLQQRLAVKLDELLADVPRHLRNVTRVSPERIVNPRERQTRLVARQRRLHHVRAVYAVDEVWGKRAALLRLGHRVFVVVELERKRLHQRANHPLALHPVRLNDRQTERRGPLHRPPLAANHPGALREPRHDVPGVHEKVRERIQSPPGGVVGHLIPQVLVLHRAPLL